MVIRKGNQGQVMISHLPFFIDWVEENQEVGLEMGRKRKQNGAFLAGWKF
ncbi:MAG: hypothetical protein NTZ47_06080 [Bacteroidetes bacterium]|nr:hypothetical protein [Bacteroidota bacterium]